MNVHDNKEFETLKQAISESLNNNKLFTVKSSGNSMWPFIKDQDQVILRKTNDLECGDIAAYFPRKSRQLIIHRVIELKNDNVCLKGDNNISADNWMKIDDIMGVVKEVRRNGKIIRIGISYGNRIIVRISRLIPFSRLLNPLYQMICLLRKATNKKH